MAKRTKINIPKEILGQAQLNQNSSAVDIIKNATIKDWLYSQLVESKQGLIAVKDWIKASGEKITPMLCNGVAQNCLRID